MTRQGLTDEERKPYPSNHWKRVENREKGKGQQSRGIGKPGGSTAVIAASCPLTVLPECGDELSQSAGVGVYPKNPLLDIHANPLGKAPVMAPFLFHFLINLSAARCLGHQLRYPRATPLRRCDTGTFFPLLLPQQKKVPTSFPLVRPAHTLVPTFSHALAGWLAGLVAPGSSLSATLRCLSGSLPPRLVRPPAPPKNPPSRESFPAFPSSSVCFSSTPPSTASHPPSPASLGRFCFFFFFHLFSLARDHHWRIALQPFYSISRFPVASALAQHLIRRAPRPPRLSIALLAFSSGFIRPPHLYLYARIYPLR